MPGKPGLDASAGPLGAPLCRLDLHPPRSLFSLSLPPTPAYLWTYFFPPYSFCLSNPFFFLPSFIDRTHLFTSEVPLCLSLSLSLCPSAFILLPFSVGPSLLHAPLSPALPIWLPPSPSLHLSCSLLAVGSSPALARARPTHRRRRPRRGAGRARPARRAGAAWCRRPSERRVRAPPPCPGSRQTRQGGNAGSPSPNSWAAPGLLAAANPPLTETPRGEGAACQPGRLPRKGPPGARAQKSWRRVRGCALSGRARP